MISVILELKSIKYFRWRAFGPNAPAKPGNIRVIFPNFQNCARCEKYLKDYKHNSLHLARKYVRIFLSLEIIWSSTFTVLRERSCCSLLYIHKYTSNHRKQFIEILHPENVTKRYILLLSSRDTAVLLAAAVQQNLILKALLTFRFFRCSFDDHDNLFHVSYQRPWLIIYFMTS